MYEQDHSRSSRNPRMVRDGRSGIELHDCPPFNGLQTRDYYVGFEDADSAAKIPITSNAPVSLSIT